MPFTPFHVGVHACVALPLQRKLDVPTFILANIIIDIEPLLVMLFNVHYPVHGYVHTFIGSFIVGSLWGGMAYALRQPLGRLMRFLRLPYSPSLKADILSGAAGGCLHVLCDAPIYTDIQPFYPLKINPLYGLVSAAMMYRLCILFFIPAAILYVWFTRRYPGFDKEQRLF
ncbi:MAG: hydrolase [Candidatus Omnitrophica bacterium]|nr:hydrolase [Candidatus Omnitrophota bacterium]